MGCTDVLFTAGSWRDALDDPRGGGSRSHRGGADGRYNVNYDRGDYRRKRFDRNYDDDEEEDGTINTTITIQMLSS